MTEQMRHTRTLECAIAYAGLGWPVLPLWSVDNDGNCLCGDKKCKSPGKHPHSKYTPHGLKDATTDGKVIAQWFNNGPINIGIRTGTESGVVVLDVDFRNGGETSLKSLGSMPRTPYAKTGGGFHYYYKHPGERVKSQHNSLGPGLDVKADGVAV